MVQLEYNINMKNLIWICLPFSIGFFALWRTAEHDLKFYKKQYGIVTKKYIRLRELIEKEQQRRIAKKSEKKS